MIEKRGSLTERDKQLRKIGFHYTIPERSRLCLYYRHPTVMRPGGRGILPFLRALQWIRIIFSPSPLTLWSFTDFTDNRWGMGREFIQLIQ